MSSSTGSIHNLCQNLIKPASLHQTCTHTPPPWPTPELAPIAGRRTDLVPEARGDSVVPMHPPNHPSTPRPGIAFGRRCLQILVELIDADTIQEHVARRPPKHQDHHGAQKSREPEPPTESKNTGTLTATAADSRRCEKHRRHHNCDWASGQVPTKHIRNVCPFWREVYA